VIYDQLAQGWAGPPGDGKPGQLHAADTIFAMRFSVRRKSDDDSPFEMHFGAPADVVRAAAFNSDDTTVQVSNTRVRRTRTGMLVNAHDGMFTGRMPDGRFWLFGTAYRNCTDFSNCTYPCGWLNNTFAAYSSPTLGMDDWRLESDNILPSVANDTATTSYFEPNVLYSTASKQYVLSWSHLMHNQSPPPVHEIPIATSPFPQGPYHRVAPLRTKGIPGSTIGLWVDQGTGINYARYNSAIGQCLEELSPDLLTTTGRYVCVKAGGEGGGVVRRNNSYYLMTGEGCCFCPAGGDALVYISRNGPLGNYSGPYEINPARNPNANKLPPAPAPAPPPAPPTPSDAPCDLHGVWASYSGTSWDANQTVTQIGAALTVWDGPAYYYPCGKPTGCKPNPYFANATVFANRTVRLTKTGEVGTLSAFNASAPDCTLISFGDGASAHHWWGKAPW